MTEPVKSDDGREVSELPEEDKAIKAFDRTPKQRAVEVLKSAEEILILADHRSLDGLGSALALKIALSNLGKKPTAVISKIEPSWLALLPEAGAILKEISFSQDLLIRFMAERDEIEKIGYSEENGRLTIVVTPSSGSFSEEKIKIESGGPKFQAVVVLDTPEPKLLGKIFEENPAFFSKLPVVNIDHHLANTQFGKINFIDRSATSTAEILVSILEALESGRPLISQAVATNLLLGLISDTDRFQSPTTTSKALTVAAQLVAAGGKKDEIVESLYKIKPYSTLKLWGRILSRLTEDEAGFVWTFVNQEDFERSGADEESVAGNMAEFLDQVKGQTLALLLIQRTDGVFGRIRFRSKGDELVVRLLDKLNGRLETPVEAVFSRPGWKLIDHGRRLVQEISAIVQADRPDSGPEEPESFLSDKIQSRE